MKLVNKSPQTNPYINILFEQHSLEIPADWDYMHNICKASNRAQVGDKTSVQK